MEKQLSPEDQLFFDQWNTIKEKAQSIQNSFNKEIAPELEKYKVPGISDAIKSIGKGIAFCGTIVTLAGVVMTIVNPVAGTTMRAIGRVARSTGGTMIGAGTAANRGASAYQKFKRGNKKGGLIDLALAAAGVGTAIMAGKRIGNSIAGLSTNNSLNDPSALVNQTRGYLRDRVPIDINSPEAPVNQIPSFINQTTGINNIEDIKFASAALDGEKVISTIEINAPDGTEALAAVTDVGEINVMNSATGEVIESIPAEEVAEVAPDVVDNAIEIEPEEVLENAQADTPEMPEDTSIENLASTEATPTVPNVELHDYSTTDPNAVIYRDLGFAKRQVPVKFAHTMDYISELNGETGVHNIFGQNLSTDQIEVLRLHPDININEVPPVFTNFDNPNMSDIDKINAFTKSMDYLKPYRDTNPDFYYEMKQKIEEKAAEQGFGVKSFDRTFKHNIDYNYLNGSGINSEDGDNFQLLSQYFSSGRPQVELPQPAVSTVETAL